MKKLLLLMTMTTALVTLAQAADVPAAGKEISRVEEATTVLNEIMAIPEKGIPPSLLNRVHAVAVIPNVVKAGFIVGGRHGKGVLVARTKEGNWSPPVFLSLTGGSVGWQIGVQATDVILAFKSRRSIERIASGKFTLGADASIAAGPVGRTASAGTDVELKAEIYSYSRSRGLFAGVALEGAVLQINFSSNGSFYGRNDLGLQDILEGKGIEMPASAKKFVKVLTSYTK